MNRAASRSPWAAWACHRLGAVALACTGLAAQAAEAPLLHTVQAPHYGDTLFHFYQDHHFTALTSLMVSQHFQRLSPHADEAEILRGGLLLTYGLHREAGEIFARLIAQGAAPAVRDRAWYFLAKIRYERGNLGEAADALSRIQGPLPGQLEEERLLLSGQVSLALGDPARAAVELRALLARPPSVIEPPKTAGVAPKRSVFSRIGSWLLDAVTFNFARDPEQRFSTAPAYARFNLGVALIRSGDIAGGKALLDEIGSASMPDDELRALRDQANVALGFTALSQDDPEGAAQALERVRLKGAHSNKALLGFGWAAAAQKKPERALVPWSELLQREASDPAVLEARLAVPYALAEVGALGQALSGYQAAIAAYAQENTALDESIAAIRGGKLVAGLVERNPDESMGWFRALTALPEMPHTGHLVPVLAQHEFQESFKNYRDLLFLTGNLGDWQEKLGVYGDMLATRRAGFTERLPQVRSKAAELRVDVLQGQRDKLAAEFGTALAAADGQAFAGAAEREQLARLADVNALLAAQADPARRDPSLGDADLAQLAERARRLQGALAWQLAEQLPERRWAAEKALADTDSGLADARVRDARLAAAQKDEPARFERFAARLAELGQRIRALQPRVAALTAEQQKALQETAVAALQIQKERLVGYTAQAQYAVAQLYDRATQRKEGERAKP
ncbi:MAG: hypothetical protein IV094_20335 [Vitreoscilla sp.]|nr:hypothetical protein [Vitreoscilla sp.]